LSTSNVRRERRKALNSRTVVAEIVVTAVFDIPNHVSDEALANDYMIKMSSYFNNADTKLILLEEDKKHVFISKKLMTSALYVEKTYEQN
jgi:hypothetical protein|tara:strand:- start:514 stop:783 length:270 start_codon:yes stop_codon:yes gene_type:complete